MAENKLARKFELAANIVIILSGLVVGVRVLKPQLFTKAHASIPDTVEVGAKLGLKSSDGISHKRTLVMALRRGCHYCEASAPFYKRLSGLANDPQKVHLMAVLPEPEPQGKNYLAGLGVDIADVQHGRFDTLKIGYTPTLLLLDQSGAVQKVWIGKLSPEREAEVLKELGL